MNRISQALGGCDRIAIRSIVRHLFQKYRPRTVVDYGCGDGAWLSEFAELGAGTVGVDRSDRLRHPIGAFVQHDLSKGGLRFGNSMCQVKIKGDSIGMSLEVAEHLPESAAAGLVDMLCAHPVVVFSAAIPGQGGWGHVNEQWQSWWASLFGERGLYPDLTVRRVFWASVEIPVWYRQNLVVYTRTSRGVYYGDLDVIHPDLWSRPSLMGLAALWRHRW